MAAEQGEDGTDARKFRKVTDMLYGFVGRVPTDDNDEEQIKMATDVEEDETDAKPWKGISKMFCGLLGQLPNEEDDHTPYEPASHMDPATSDVYNMSYPRRGQAIIINNKDFSDQLRRRGYNERRGTDVDAASMEHQLKRLGFTVDMYKNVTCDEIFDILQASSSADHSDADCFVCVMLSHGEDGVFYGVDDKVEIKSVLDLFKGHNCRTLAGKPKLFFIQACRGHCLDEGGNLNVVDAKRDRKEAFDLDIKIKIPSEADVLVAYSTVPGYYSWRNSANGSWFIQALAQTLAEDVREDIMRTMTKVNRRVAFDFQSNTLPTNPGMHEMKQIPCITSMLTKDLILIPKA